MQASQTLVDTYFFDAGGSVPKTESTVKEGKAKSMCLPGKEFHLQCSQHFYKDSMSKGH